MKHGEIFLNVNRVFKGLKKLHPEWILPTVALLLPRCGAQLGACSLCPRGIGNPALAKITDEGVNNLIAGMEHSEVMKDRLNPDRDAKLVAKRKVAQEKMEKAKVKMQSEVAKTTARLMTKKTQSEEGENTDCFRTSSEEEQRKPKRLSVGDARLRFSGTDTRCYNTDARLHRKPCRPRGVLEEN